jgi:ABC-type phosphate transport system auxiliary subunit
MFAIACLMIVSLLAFVLWQGLWTLWPRTYSIYGRKDGTLVGGELYAKASLEGQETLYLRTGNYDVSNQHFAYVSSSELVEQSGWLAPDLWLVERKEWGNLYGFPKQLSWAQAAPEDFVRLVQDGMRQTAQIDRELGEAKNEL